MRLSVVILLLFASTSHADITTKYHLWLPTRPHKGVGQSYPAANVMVCSTDVPEMGITGTQMVWYNTSGGGAGVFCGVAIYSKDGTMRITSSGAQDCSATGTRNATGLVPFTLTAGIAVQVCACATAGMSYLGTITASQVIQSMQNNLSTPIMTTAATPCVAGDPPLSTGALTGILTRGSIYVLIGTDTP